MDGLKKFSYVEEGCQIINSRVINSVISGNAYIRDIHVRGEGGSCIESCVIRDSMVETCKYKGCVVLGKCRRFEEEEGRFIKKYLK